MKSKTITRVNDEIEVLHELDHDNELTLFINDSRHWIDREAALDLIRLLEQSFSLNLEEEL